MGEIVVIGQNPIFGYLFFRVYFTELILNRLRFCGEVLDAFKRVRFAWKVGTKMCETALQDIHGKLLQFFINILGSK